jgi:hypothetical protein
MDRDMLRDHLRLAERHVNEGEMHLNRQYGVIADLERGNHDTQLAHEVLRTLLATQKSHEADRDRLMRELDKPARSR